MSSVTVLATSCRGVLRAVEAMGLDADRLLAQIGVDRAVVEDPDGRLPPDTVLRLWGAAYTLTEDPDLALHVAEHLPPGAFRVLDYLVGCAPSVGEAFSKISAYFPWVDDTVQLPITRQIDAQGGLHTFGLGTGLPPELVPPAAVEFTFATCLLRIRAATGQPVRPARVDFAGPARPDGELRRVFGVAPRYEAGINQLCFDDETWRCPSATADPSLLEVLEGHAARLVQAVTRAPPATRAVRGALLRLGPAASLDEVARSLGMSGRTAQRRLAQEDTTFAAIVDAVRQDLAHRFLAEPHLSVAECALLLGFADQSAFTRAFKRWTGTTPAAARRGARP